MFSEIRISYFCPSGSINQEHVYKSKRRKNRDGTGNVGGTSSDTDGSRWRQNSEQSTSVFKNVPESCLAPPVSTNSQIPPVSVLPHLHHQQQQQQQRRSSRSWNGNGIRRSRRIASVEEEKVDINSDEEDSNV